MARKKSTLTAVFYIYQQAFKEDGRLGVAAAGAVVLLIIIMVVTVIQRMLFRTETGNEA